MSSLRVTLWTTSILWATLVPPATAQPIVFSDTFSSRQGQQPLSWKIVGAPTARFWYVEKGSLNSGPGEDLGGDGSSYAVIAVAGSETWTDYSISCRFWMPSRNGRVVLTGRWRDERNYYRAYLEVSRQDRSAHIERVADGQVTSLASAVNRVGADIPLIANSSADRAHHLRFGFVGATMALYLDGKRLIQATDGTLDRGTGGVGVRYCTAYFDDVVVEPERILGPTAAVAETVPDTAGAKQVYRFLMRTFDTEAEATQLRGELIRRGYLNVTVEAAGDKWDVLVGAFMTEVEAQQERANLEARGMRIRGIVVTTAGTTQYSPVAIQPIVAPSLAYTVRVGRFATQQEAEDLKEKLALDGYYGSQVRQEPDGFSVVLGSFRTRSDADRYRALLESDGYKVLEVAEVEPAKSPGPTLITPTRVSVAIRESDVWKSLTQEQRRQFEQFLQTAAAQPAESPQLYMDLKKTIEDVRLETRKQIAAVVNNLEQRETKERNLIALFDKANKAAAAEQFDEAQRFLAQILTQDPANTLVPVIQREIQLRRETLGRMIGERLTEADRVRLQQDVNRARTLANEWKSQQYYQNALQEFRRAQRILQDHQLDEPIQLELAGEIKAMEEAIKAGGGKIDERIKGVEDKIGGINTRVRGVETGQDSLRGQVGGYNTYFIGLAAGVGVLALLFIVVFLSARRRNRQLLEQMRSLTLKPMMEISGGGAGAAALGAQRGRAEIGGGAPQALEEPAPSFQSTMAPTEPPPAAEPAEPAEPPDIFAPTASSLGDPLAGVEEVSPFDVGETQPQQEAAPSVEEEPETEVSMRLPEEPPEPAPTVVEEAPADESPFAVLESLQPEAESTAQMPAGELDEIDGAEPQGEEAFFGLEEPLARTPAASLTVSEPEPDVAPLQLDDIVLDTEDTVPDVVAPPPVQEETAPLDLDMMGVGAPATEAQPSPGAASGVFFEQNFEDEVGGATPNNWQGAQESYEFASLTVADETPSAGGGRYMRFEKTEGAGSAYYSCQFPDATGQVSIEFDLRCDRKNKFLLGFYVEKDGDFRQSIHTIVHQPDSQGEASLRIQGEAIPYEMGTWRHIKYVVNLSSGRMSGYVDGQTVLDDIRLTNCPRSLNTLSIRDNIPTTGVLLIDNVRITRG